MSFQVDSNHTRSSITLYYVVALNADLKFKNTITRNEAAQVLADNLQINHRAPESWMRGNFEKHPISRENFLRFVRIYRTKAGLESPKEIRALAIDLYGEEYKRAIELLDLADRESDLSQDVPVILSDQSDEVTVILNFLAFCSPEAVKSACLTLIAYQWSVHTFRHKYLLG